jgi:negative regulator of genetic competence, sporulation and motility
MANISKKLKTKRKEFLLIFHGFRRHYRDIIYLSNTYLRYENLGRVLSIYLMEYYLSVVFRRIQDDLACIDDMYSYIVWNVDIKYSARDAFLE